MPVCGDCLTLLQKRLRRRLDTMPLFGHSKSFRLEIANDGLHSATINVLMVKSQRCQFIGIKPGCRGEVKLKSTGIILLVYCDSLTCAIDIDSPASAHTIVITNSAATLDGARFTNISHPITVVEAEKKSKFKKTDVDIYIPANSVASALLATPNNQPDLTDKFKWVAKRLCLGITVTPDGTETPGPIPSYMIVKEKLMDEFGGEIFDENKTWIKQILKDSSDAAKRRGFQTQSIPMRDPVCVALASWITASGSRSVSIMPPPVIAYDLSSIDAVVRVALDYDIEDRCIQHRMRQRRELARAAKTSSGHDETIKRRFNQSITSEDSVSHSPSPAVSHSASGGNYQSDDSRTSGGDVAALSRTEKYAKQLAKIKELGIHGDMNDEAVLNLLEAVNGNIREACDLLTKSPSAAHHA